MKSFLGRIRASALTYEVTGVETLCSGGETTDSSLQVLVNLAGNMFYVTATSAANSSERVFSIDDHVVDSKRANLKDFFSERLTLFQQCFEKVALKSD